jgi:hypothetical protein
MNLRRGAGRQLVRLALLFSFAACGGEGGKEIRGVGGTPLGAVKTFTLTSKLALIPQGGSPSESHFDVPSYTDLVLRLDPVAPAFLISGPEGRVQSVKAVSSDGLTFKAAEPFTTSFGPSPCGGEPRFIYDTFSVSVSGDAITGRAEGKVRGGFDTGYSYELAMTMSGQQDHAPPTFGPYPSQIQPTAALRLAASEALPADATAQLVANGESIALEPIVVQTEPRVVAGFDKPADVALRPGTTYQLLITPWRDLAGNAGGRPPTVTTTEAWPAVIADGFESAPHDFASAVVLGTDQIEPISGARSAVIAVSYDNSFGPAAGVLWARMAVPPGSRFVRLAARWFSGPASPLAPAVGVVAARPRIRATVAAPGGKITRARSAERPETVVMVVERPGADRNPYPIALGETQTIEIPLPSGTGSEVLVELEVEQTNMNCPPFGSGTPKTFYMIDDLRVE